MGKMGKQMADLGNPLNMLKKLGSGAKNEARSDNLKHTIFYFRPQSIGNFYVVPCWCN